MSLKYEPASVTTTQRGRVALNERLFATHERGCLSTREVICRPPPFVQNGFSHTRERGVSRTQTEAL